MLSGWGYYMYAIADNGERIHYSHPGEMGRVRQVIEENDSQGEIDRRTGSAHIASVFTVKRRYMTYPDLLRSL